MILILYITHGRNSFFPNASKMATEKKQFGRRIHGLLYPKNRNIGF
jgi:hypothetical protein